MMPFLIDVYKEMERETIREFAEQGLVHWAAGSGFAPEKVGRANIVRMKEATRTLKNMMRDEKEQLIRNTREFFPTIYYHEERGSFGIENDRDLKRILYAVEDKLVYTLRSHKRKISPRFLNLD